MRRLRAVEECRTSVFWEALLAFEGPQLPGQTRDGRHSTASVACPPAPHNPQPPQAYEERCNSIAVAEAQWAAQCRTTERFRLSAGAPLPLSWAMGA